MVALNQCFENKTLSKFTLLWQSLIFPTFSSISQKREKNYNPTQQISNASGDPVLKKKNKNKGSEHNMSPYCLRVAVQVSQGPDSPNGEFNTELWAKIQCYCCLRASSCVCESLESMEVPVATCNARQSHVHMAAGSRATVEICLKWINK